jgi:hypothetical protein
MLEKDLENLIAKHPDKFFPTTGFKLIGQQVKLGKCYADIIFEDKHQRKIIIEVKRGILSRDAAGQVIEYYGLLKTQSPEDVVELILCANVIPKERRLFLETVGIECKELGINVINRIAKKVGYEFINSQKTREQRTSIKMPQAENIWIFQANPKQYDILKMLDNQDVIKKFHWSIKQHKNIISKNQIGLIWLSGKEAGIYAITEIISNPDYFVESDAEKEYWHDNTEEEGAQLKVKMKLIRNLTNNPIIKETIKKRNGLQNLKILKQPWGKNPFNVTIEEWELIKKLIDN